MHLEPLTNEVKEIKRQAYVLSVSMEIDEHLVGFVLTREEEAGDVVNVLLLMHLYPLVLNNRLSHKFHLRFLNHTIVLLVRIITKFIF